MRLEIQERRSHIQIETPGNVDRFALPISEAILRELKIQAAVQYSGSLGNLTYSHNLGGQYIRTRSIPVNPNTERQGQVRSFLANWASNWTNLLDQGQRDTWITFAETHTHTDAFGNEIYLPPHCWYIMLSSRLQDAGLPVPTLAPVGAGPTGLTTFSVAFTGPAAADVTFTPVIPAGVGLQLWMTLPVSVGSSPNFNQARLVGYSPLAQASPWAATLPHSVFAGDRAVFFMAAMAEDGRVGAKMTDIEDA